ANLVDHREITRGDCGLGLFQCLINLWCGLNEIGDTLGNEGCSCGKLNFPLHAVNTAKAARVTLPRGGWVEFGLAMLLLFIGVWLAATQPVVFGHRSPRRDRTFWGCGLRLKSMALD